MIKLSKDGAYHFLLVACNPAHSLSSVLFCLPCLESIKATYPKSKISFLIHSSAAYVLANNPLIHSIIYIDAESNLRRGIKRERIDIAICFYSNRRANLALFLAGVKTRIGLFSKLHSLLFNCKIKQLRFHSKKHEIAYNLDLLRFLGCSSAGAPKIYLTIQQKQKSASRLEARFKDGQAPIIFLPGGRTGGVAWPAKNFFVVANLLARDHAVLLITSPSENEGYKVLLEQFENLNEDNLLVEEDGAELLGLISYARLFVSNNGLLLHCACALGVETLSIFPCAKNNNPLRHGVFSGKRPHLMITPHGVFSSETLAAITASIATNDISGLRLGDIDPNLVYEIVKSRI